MNNNLAFGRRYGFEPIEIPFQVDEINTELRTELWSAYYIFFYSSWESKETYRKQNFSSFNRVCWLHFFKLPFDEYPKFQEHIYKNLIKAHFLQGNWVKIYEFLEYILEKADKETFEVNKFRDYVNVKLRDNNSGFTIIQNQLVPITNETEIEEIEKLNSESNKFIILSGIKKHLQSSLDFISSKENPNYRNSIKESISMVEVISRIIEPTENSLGGALNKLEKNQKLNPLFKKSLEKMYAYTNGKNGIRHAIMNEENIELEDARFFLISCSAITNYLIEKAKKYELIK